MSWPEVPCNMLVSIMPSMLRAHATVSITWDSCIQDVMSTHWKQGWIIAGSVRKTLPWISYTIFKCKWFTPKHTQQHKKWHSGHLIKWACHISNNRQVKDGCDEMCNVDKQNCWKTLGMAQNIVHMITQQPIMRQDQNNLQKPQQDANLKDSTMTSRNL